MRIFGYPEDDPAAERGMLGRQQTQDGAASKVDALFKAVRRARERTGPQLNIVQAIELFPGLARSSFLPISGY